VYKVVFIFFQKWEFFQPWQVERFAVSECFTVDRGIMVRLILWAVCVHVCVCVFICNVDVLWLNASMYHPVWAQGIPLLFPSLPHLLLSVLVFCTFRFLTSFIYFLLFHPLPFY